MRLVLATTLILLFLWLLKAQTSSDNAKAREAASLSDAAVSLLLSPLSLYSWMASMLLRFVMSIPALVLSSLYHSLLLLLAAPWCVATVCVSLLLTGLHVGLYLLHMALVVGVVAILTLARHKMADGNADNERRPNEVQISWRKLEEHQRKPRSRQSSCRVAQQG